MDRIIPDRPIASKYNGSCAVCGGYFSVGEMISVFFHLQFNLWRHANCLQLWFVQPLKYKGECNECHKDIALCDGGYWSKNNGIWCVDCGEQLAPKVTMAYSKSQNIKATERREISL
tara:strand:+ start:564 stop:914 length:351 start_codon:yes stop_codon:yes gene_type:complete